MKTGVQMMGKNKSQQSGASYPSRGIKTKNSTEKNTISLKMFTPRDNTTSAGDDGTNDRIVKLTTCPSEESRLYY